MSTTQTELRLSSRIDERVNVQKLHDTLLAEADGGDLDDAKMNQARSYRSRCLALDEEIAELTAQAESDRAAAEQSKKIHRALAGAGGVSEGDDGVVYDSMAVYARDVIMSRQTGICSRIASTFGDPSQIQAAQSRLELLKRVPANTLSSNVAGLIPHQHIAQIFQVIDDSRPIVQSAERATLERGVLSYPRVDTSPVVAVQGTEKTEAGNTGMVISMQTATASTYLGGGDLSWQAINWSTPNALDLWFRLAAADYALKTETDAATVISSSAFNNNIDSGLLSSTPTFAEFMTAIGLGYGEVYDNSGRTVNTIYMAPDRFGYMLGLTSAATSPFLSVSGDRIGPLNVVVSRGLNAGEIIVGDRNGLLVAETAGAPVELRVVEPAIGGVEVGIIGAFEAVVVDDGAFSAITTAS